MKTPGYMGSDHSRFIIPEFIPGFNFWFSVYQRRTDNKNGQKVKKTTGEAIPVIYKTCKLHRKPKIKSRNKLGKLLLLQLDKSNLRISLNF
jgi:hypothetical protein